MLRIGVSNKKGGYPPDPVLLWVVAIYPLAYLFQTMLFHGYSIIVMLCNLALALGGACKAEHAASYPDAHVALSHASLKTDWQVEIIANESSLIWGIFLALSTDGSFTRATISSS